MGISGSIIKLILLSEKKTKCCKMNVMQSNLHCAYNVMTKYQLRFSGKLVTTLSH